MRGATHELDLLDNIRDIRLLGGKVFHCCIIRLVSDLQLCERWQAGTKAKGPGSGWRGPSHRHLRPERMRGAAMGEQPWDSDSGLQRYRRSGQQGPKGATPFQQPPLPPLGRQDSDPCDAGGLSLALLLPPACRGPPAVCRCPFACNVGTVGERVGALRGSSVQE